MTVFIYNNISVILLKNAKKAYITHFKSVYTEFIKKFFKVNRFSYCYCSCQSQLVLNFKTGWIFCIRFLQTKHVMSCSQKIY
jgi:hypothetical protein